MHEMSQRPPRFVGVDGPEDRERAEAVLALYDRYASEFVEALRICPWAEDARKTGRVERVVVWNRVVRPAELHDEAKRIAADEGLDVGLLLLPFAPADRAEFERLARAVREALDEGADLALAAFHPAEVPEPTTPAKTTALARRSPVPVLQLVRRSVLNELRTRSDASHPRFVDPATVDLAALLAAPPRAPLHEWVATQNFERMRDAGFASIDTWLSGLADEAARITRGS
jgi:hypothetical protein